MASRRATAIGERAAGPAFWRTVFVLLGAARRRADGRFQRQRQLSRRQGRRSTAIWSIIGFALLCVFGGLVHAGLALGLMMVEPTAERLQAEARGRVVVEEWFAGRTEEHEAAAVKHPESRAAISRDENDDVAVEAPRLVHEDGQDAGTIAARLRATMERDPKAFLAETSLWWQPGRLPDIVALIVVLWWAVMLLCLGESAVFDLQRQRHPMWEWLFSHPVSAAAVFAAELLAPIAGNPVHLMAPLFPGILFGWAYGWVGGVAGAVLVGIPLTVALAGLGKAIEIRALLRLGPRARGALLGFLTWLGFVLSWLVFLLASSLPAIVETVGRWLAPHADRPWPPARLLLGRTDAGYYIFWHGLLACWLVAAVLMLLAVALAAASVRHGLVAPSGAGVRAADPSRFGRRPLYRKELLWFRRDGRAIIQAILVPLSMAALQAFNLRGLISAGASAWATLCGIAILFGTYFLLVLGPTSLSSEGQALWIAQTWPYGLESLLKAKAKLWSWIASAIVGVVLLYAAWRFPGDIGAILIVAVLWWVFARSLAEKTVTLATAPTSSGEPQRAPATLQLAAMLGTLTFAVGVLTRQWSLAVAGVVYSVLTAAAMWQNFRYRLPFLSDPWSETLPPPPTLLHAMVAISAMVEGVALLSGLALWAVDRDRIAVVDAGLYGVCAIAAALAVARFIAGRGVRLRDIWFWRDENRDPRPFLDLDGPETGRVVLVVLGAAALGAALGGVAHLYLWALHLWPDAARLIDQGRQQMDAVPNARAAYAVMAIGIAPFAEEFLFRGLLYRALDRDGAAGARCSARPPSSPSFIRPCPGRR